MSTAPARNFWLALNFAATIFVSAFLLFQIQPLVSKYILPWFGGTPAVWTTCMLFFQTLLFAGYAYAHFLDRWLPPKRQAMVHLGLIVLALALLSVLPDDAWKPQGEGNPVWRILGLLAASVGLPYFVLSSTGPLIQAWFARAYPGRIPYRLYALSNVGSLLALLSYPFVFERIFDIRDQATYWSWGFVLYAALCGYAAVTMWMAFRKESGQWAVGNGQGAGSRGPAPAVSRDAESAERSAPSTQHGEPPDAERPNWLQRVLWLVLPAFASVTLLATTNHVCADISVMPFLWVVPLSLYLVTFIVAFDHPRWYVPSVIAVFTVAMIYAVAVVESNWPSDVQLYDSGTPGKIYRGFKEGWAEKTPPPVSPELDVNYMTYAGMNFAAMFGICMLCHGELVRLRPHPRYLTSFYLMIAAGGAIGGVLVTLVAPRVFVTYFEWNLALFLGYLMAVWLILRGIANFTAGKPRAVLWANLLWIVPLLALPTLVIGGVGVYDLMGYLRKDDTDVKIRVRSFFGTLLVEERNRGNPLHEQNVLQHGRITHGMQYTETTEAADPGRRSRPNTYYGPDSGIGHTVEFYYGEPQADGLRIGTVGLGTGTMAAFVRESEEGKKPDSIRFYEIDPKVIGLTEPGQWFTYLKDARERGGSYNIVLGDARLSMERELAQGQPQHFHVLVLDAFSGDAIPVHLLTEEAVKVYLEHLATGVADGIDGALAVHITNRYVDLEPVVDALAAKFKLGHVLITNYEDDSDGIYESDWIILSRNERLLAYLKEYAEPAPEQRSSPTKSKPPVLWTDAFSNLFDVLKP